MSLTARELAGAINAAKSVHVFVALDMSLDDEDHGLWMKIEKVEARRIVAWMRENGVHDIAAWSERGELYIDCNDAEGDGEGEGEELEEETEEEEEATD